MSFFESLVEGTANAAANSLGNYQKRQQVLEDDERNQQQAIERFRQQQQIQQDMAEKARQEQQARLQEQLGKAEEEGAKLTKGQALAALNKDYGSNLTEADVLPEELDAYGPDAVGKIDNQLKAALKGGMYDAAAALAKGKAEAVASAAAAWKRHVEEVRLAQGDKKLDQQHKESMARIDASERRSSNSAKQDTYDKLTTRKGQALRALALYKNTGVEATDPDYQAEVAELAEVNRLLAAQNERRTGTETPPAKAAPAKPQSTKDLAKSGKFTFLGTEKSK